MQVVVDIETNSLVNPTKVWVIVCKDIDTGARYVFRHVHEENEKERFLQFASKVTRWVGHNLLEFDLPWLYVLCGLPAVPTSDVLDTLILSRLIDYSRPSGHSIESYGEEFGLEKIPFNDFKQYSKEMEDYCIRDVDICHKIYLKYIKVIKGEQWQPSIRLEHQFQLLVNDLHNNGFSFNIDKANKLLIKVLEELELLDKDILKAFPPKAKLIREVTPKVTKYGTISKSSIPRALGADLSVFTEGAPFSYISWHEFNPSSHKQIVEVLNDAGWQPIDKTQTHIELEREINRLKYLKQRDPAVDTRLTECYTKLDNLKRSGWKVNENNLTTLPDDAPAPARLLARRILLESRRRTLVEWLGLVNPETKRIHGKFYGIGAWTHRMAHQNPNTANIPTDVKLYGKEMRALWQAPKNRLLVGVDAEGIQLRIFAHYIDDKEFTDALVNGDKRKKTDPHSFNQRILGSVCESRQIAKRFVYALLLGAGLGKLAQILGCSEGEAKDALARLMQRYAGFTELKRNVLPSYGKRGWFPGLDGRKVAIPGDTPGARTHLAMSGLLQNGEIVCMKKAALLWDAQLKADEELKRWLFVNMVHDEWQTECANNIEIAMKIAKIQADSLRIVGEELGLKCPLAGSYWSDDHNDYTFGPNWSVTH